MAFSLKRKEISIVELEREAAESAEELAVAQEAHDKKAAEDTKHRDAVVQAKQKHEDAKARLADAHAEAKRREFARMADPLIATFVAKNKAATIANAELVTAGKAVAAIVPTMNPQFIVDVEALTKTVAGAADELVGTARHHVNRVAIGSESLTPPAPPHPAPEPVTPKIERQQVYFRTAAKWREGAETVAAAAFSFAYPPQNVATLALARGFASLPDAEITRQTIASWGVRREWADVDQCVDLDRIDEQPAAEQQSERALPPGFEERIGPARTMLIDAGRV
jgi:hypothetical protein